VEEKRSLMDIIRIRQKNWIGHVMGGDSSLQRKIMEPWRKEWKKEEDLDRSSWTE